MKKFIRIVCSLCFLSMVAGSTAFAFQDIPDNLPPEVKERLEKLKASKKKGGDPKKKKPKFKKYEDVITKKAKTQKGIFTTHRVDDKLYYEFDPKHFGKEFLWLVQVAKVEAGRGLGGLEARRLIVKFERLEDSILIRNVSHRLRAKKGSTEEFAVQASSIDGIVAALKIVTFGPKKTPVVEMTKIFKGDVAELSPKRALNAIAMDRTKVFLTSIKAFEKNIETRVLATYRRRPARSILPGLIPSPSAGNVTAEIHHSMVALPDRAMRPRYRDRRVGFFAGSYLDFSSDKNQAERITLIRRWRLEKKKSVIGDERARKTDYLLCRAGRSEEMASSYD